MARVHVGDLTDMREFEVALGADVPLTHWFPTARSYRRSGASEPQVGDMAWCGHVLEVPGEMGIGPTRCSECLMIRRGRGLV